MGVQKGRRATTDKRKRCLNYVRAINKRAWTTGLLDTRIKRATVTDKSYMGRIRMLSTYGDVNFVRTNVLCLENALLISRKKR